MMKLGSRLGFSSQANKEEEEEDVDDRDEDEEVKEDEIDAYLIPSDTEKKAVLASFDAMRKESLFCDISFVCQGVLFRAHRVIVSSWSRWLRAFLCDSPEEEVLALDIFDPQAFRAVLDYMYGVALEISVQNAESIIKVVRRLELQRLEQQCWRFLITALDPDTNCEYLHDLADRYDCPPLKLAAWKILKERIPDIDNFPGQKRKKNGVVDETKKNFSYTGLTGPADPAFRNSRVSYGSHFTRLADQENFGDRHNMPSVFEDPSKGGDEDEYDDEEGEEESKGNMKGKRLEDLDETATATEVINAWAIRLKEVYAKCSAVETSGYEEEEPQQLKLDDTTPNVKLIRSPKKRSSVVDRSALLGEPTDMDNHSQSTIGNHGKSSKPMITENNLRYFTSANSIDWEEVLTNFYTIMNMHSKIAGISTILKTWSGKEEEMLNSLLEKYEKTIPKKLSKYLQHVIQLLESRTDSSFHKPVPKVRMDI